MIVSLPSAMCNLGSLQPVYMFGALCLWLQPSTDPAAGRGISDFDNGHLNPSSGFEEGAEGSAPNVGGSSLTGDGE